MPVTWDAVRAKVNRIAENQGEWAGMPVPISGKKLVVEPRHPHQGLNGMGFASDDDEGPEQPSNQEKGDGYTLINQWYSWKYRSDVFLVREENGRITKALLPTRIKTTANLFDQIEVAAQAWDLDAEVEAQEKLRSLVSETAWKYYVLIGMFLETSKRSNVTYLFRKLAPTVALGRTEAGSPVAICSLCLHPIGYYADTPCGVMVPTDDVIAHLVMMRGDEPLFWRKANQQAVWRNDL